MAGRLSRLLLGAPVPVFPPDLETAYQAHLEPNKRHSAREGGLLAALLFVLFGILDVWAIPSALEATLAIRFLLVLPMALFIAWAAGEDFFIRHYRLLMAILFLGMGSAIQAMILLAATDEVAHFSYYPGLILVVIGLYNWTYLDWRETAGIGLVLLVLHIGSAFASHALLPDSHGPTLHGINLLADVFFFVSANLIGVFSFRLKERQLRALFLAQRALEEEKGRAEALARVKSDFLASMSHEIRTPLNAMLGFAQLGLRESRGRGSQETFRRIADAGQLLLGLINDILDFSKIEAGRLELEQEPMDLLHLLHSVRALVAQAAAQKGLALVVESTPELPASCLGAPLRVTQVLANLLANAVKFTEQGEVRLTAGREAAWLVFRVADSGIGMDAATQARLFQPFHQGDGSITRKYGGTGLGLAISQRLARRMGGEILVSSRPGAGSLFEFRLPLRQAAGLAGPLPPQLEPPPVEPALPVHVPRLEGYRLLVAEDNPVNRLLLEDILAAEGAHCVFATNGREALAAVARQGAAAFDLVLSDIQMPELDGYETARRLAVLAPGLPVVGLTAHALEGERERCLAAGMVEHLTKPIDIDHLVSVLLRHLPASPATAAVPPPAGEPGEPGEAVAPADQPAAPITAPIIANASAMLDWPALRARYASRPAFLTRLLTLLRDNYADTPGQLRRLAATGDWLGVSSIAHGLKGMAGNLCAEPLRQLAARAEAAARGTDPEAAAEAQRLAAALEQLLAESGLPAPATAPPPPLDAP